MTEGFSLPTEPCGNPSCNLRIHHLCQGEFEKKFEEVLGELEMGKRCVSCLLLENDLFDKEICSKIGCSIKGSKEIEWLSKSSVLQVSPGPEGSATRRLSIGASPLDDSPTTARTQALALVAEELVLEEEEEDAPEVLEVSAIDKGPGIASDVSHEFRSRVELCARNLRESWGHTQKAKKALWAFFVPSEPAKPGTDPTAYRSGSLEVACFLCHASKTGALHPEFPVSKDEDQRRNDKDIDSWSPSLSKDNQGRVPKSVFTYKHQDGNGTVKYHVNKYHSQELHEVRLCV
jgi:hypothetical protein